VRNGVVWDPERAGLDHDSRWLDSLVLCTIWEGVTLRLVNKNHLIIIIIIIIIAIIFIISIIDLLVITISSMSIIIIYRATSGQPPRFFF